jgi:erythromycin esterase-like protein
MITRVVFISSLYATAACAQPYLNLDFETATRGQLWNWSGCVSQYQCVPDSAIFESGVQSLRIDSQNAATTGSLGVSSQYFPLNLVQGHHVHVSGWMKTNNVNGYAAVWWRVDGASGVISLDNMSQTGPRGTTDWQQYSFDRDVSPAAVDIVFGVFLSGTGTAWFDNLEVDIDGVAFNQGPSPYTGEPIPAQLNWISSNAIPVAGVDPTLPSDDLAPLANLIGGAHIVALGHDTYGTSEIFRMDHRIVEYLASQMGFNVFAIEANMPQAYALNDYVLNGNGDPGQLLKAMNFWGWNTQEMLDMIQWMYQYNQSGNGPVQFSGFDMQTPDAAEENARSFISQADPGYSVELNQAFADVHTYEYGLGDFAEVQGSFPVATAAGKQVHYTGYVKTQDITFGYAGLWWTAWDANNKELAFGNSETSGTTDWKQYSVTVNVPANTASITFGALQAGNGTAWFDQLAVTVNGVPYTGSLDLSSGSFHLFTAGTGNDFDLEIDSSVTHSGNPTVHSTYIGVPIPTKAAMVAECAGIVTYLQSSRNTYLSEGIAATDTDWGTQNARLVLQYAEWLSDSNARDASMATNADWILSQQPPGAKIILWAHNTHVSRATGSMGSYLAAQHGSDYVVLGSAFHDGQYNASGAPGIRPYTASPSFPGSAEYYMHTSGLAPLILPMQQASPGDPGSSWLTGEIMFRSIEYAPIDGFNTTSTLNSNFDALVFFDQTTPTALLP